MICGTQCSFLITSNNHGANLLFQGILLLKELFNSHPDGKRDYLFYLSIGNARIKEYNKALHYVKAFLEIEPANQQVLALEVSFGTLFIACRELSNKLFKYRQRTISETPTCHSLGQSDFWLYTSQVISHLPHHRRV